MTDHAALRRAAHQFLHTADGIEGKLLPGWITVRHDDRSDVQDLVITIRDEKLISGEIDGFEFVTFLRPIPTPTPGDQ